MDEDSTKQEHVPTESTTVTAENECAESATLLNQESQNNDIDMENTDVAVKNVNKNIDVCPVKTYETTLQCFDCNVQDCVMWRKLDVERVICNICHLKRIKNNSTQSSINGKNYSMGSVTSNTSAKAKDAPTTVRISKRKSKANKKFTNGVYADRIIKNGNSKNRRNLFKKKPFKSTKGVASIVASNCIYHDGLLYEVGDIVCTSDIHGGTYFAQLRGFLQDDFCEKSAVITWLIPTVANLHHFDPMLFVPGLDEETARPMECFSFVCHAPTNLFKARGVHPPYHRTQSSLDNLIYVAQSMKDTNFTEEKITKDKNTEIDSPVENSVEEKT